MLRYLEAMRVTNYSERTVENRDMYIGVFIEWCEARSIRRPQEVTKPIMTAISGTTCASPRASRCHSRRRSLARARARLLQVADAPERVALDPASEIELPRAEKQLLKHVLTADEAEAVMQMPDIADPIGLRDRAILETLYSTGIRRMEVINLTVFDLDQERGTLMVRQGKGKNDRMVPIGDRAIAWLGRYLNDARPQLVLPPDPGTLFLTQEGEEISCHRLTQLVRGYVVAADMGKSGACRLFRHTCATLMLEGGADIRYIQEMLGHVELSTTQIYTQVSIRKLKAVHTLTHPGAKLERATAGAQAGADASEPRANGGVPKSSPAPTCSSPWATAHDAAVNAMTLPEVAAEALFAALDAEAEEEATGGP